jgi:hypothetical protein
MALVRCSRTNLYGTMTYGGSTLALHKRPVFSLALYLLTSSDTEPLLKLWQIEYDTY